MERKKRQLNIVRSIFNDNKSSETSSFKRIILKVYRYAINEFTCGWNPFSSAINVIEYCCPSGATQEIVPLTTSVS